MTAVPGLMDAAALASAAATMPAGRFVASVGGKAAGLAELAARGLPVPATWVVPAGCPASALGELIAGVPDSVRHWAVRSSATVEDGSAHSFAGLFRTELNVPRADLIAATERVRASAGSPRVAAYCAAAGIAPGGIEVAVVLQPYCRPAAAGVWVGRSLHSGRLEWVPGDGDALVSGKVRPSAEEWGNAGPAREDAGRPPLRGSGGDVGRCCQAAQRALGQPADLEFLLADRDLTLLWTQYRPVTATPPRETPGRPSPSRSLIRGVPGSPGKARGRAIALDRSDDQAWRPGSVLVTRHTAPEWVPLMAQARALVTAEGGSLCHAAIIARELRLPCVTGVGAAALASIVTGTQVLVDGDAGAVTVLSQPPDGGTQSRHG